MAAQLWIVRTKEFRTPIVADGWSCQTWEVCCCRENGWTKKATIKISRRLLFIPIFYEWYKKIPYSLSIRLYLDQLINLNSIRKADKSRLSCAILIKIYREVTQTLRNQSALMIAESLSVLKNSVVMDDRTDPERIAMIQRGIE